MTTTLRTPNGSTRTSLDPALPSVPARRRAPVVLLGLLMTLGSGLAFALWSSSIEERESVLVAARPIPAGATIAAGDLRTVELGGASGVSSIPSTQGDALVGAVALTDVASGAVLHRELFAAEALIGPGETVVGMLLEPGAVPVANLRSGDRVRVVSMGGGGDGGRVQGTPGVLTDATVLSAQPPSELTASALVSLVVSEEDSIDVARAAGAGAIRLVLLPVG